MKKRKAPDLARRSVLKGSALAGIAALTPAADTNAQGAAAAEPAPSPSHAPLFPNRVAETQIPPALEVLTEGRSGSDFMVDCIKSLGFDYIAATPGSSFRGLHESLINYGENKSPEFMTCTHEEVSAAMAHGYAKASGKPIPYEELDLKQAWESFDIQHDLTRKGIEKFAADYRATLARPA